MKTASRLLASICFVLLLQSIAASQSTITGALNAIKAGDVRLALRLLDDVEDVNVENGALLYEAILQHQYEAILQHQSDIIDKLLTRGADPNLRDDLLQITVLNKRDSITLLLLSRGADPNRHGPYGGMSSLSEASMQGNIVIMRALIEKGADVNYNDYVGSGTPLILAIEQNKYDAVQLLLDKGADPSIGAKFHGYPWEIATKGKNKRMLDLLMRYRSNCKEEPEQCK